MRQTRGAATGCAREGCARAHLARGFCRTHYYAARASGEITTIYRVEGAAVCDREDCEEGRYSRGRCKRHYDEGRATGEFTDPCLVPSCSLGGIRDGLCAGHSGRARRYGFTVEGLEALDSVEGCDVCLGPAEHVDHDHATGVVRGVLCRACNTALGQVGDDRDRLFALILYLDRARAAVD